MTLNYANPGTGSPIAGPPSPQHLAEIVAARHGGRSVRRAVAVSKFSGWTTALFAAITVIFSLTSPASLALGVGMGVISFIEFRGGEALKRLDISAPRRLALNQCAFGFLLFAYAAWSLWVAMHTPSELARDPQMVEALGPMLQMEGTINLVVYSVIMLVALLGPGLTAWYYATRTAALRKYLTGTPEWILHLQRAGMQV